MEKKKIVKKRVINNDGLNVKFNKIINRKLKEFELDYCGKEYLDFYNEGFDKLFNITKDDIVKVNIKIFASDLGKLDINKLQNYLKENSYHVIINGPIVIQDRNTRMESLDFELSEEKAIEEFLKNKNPKRIKEILEKSLRIISKS